LLPIGFIDERVLTKLVVIGGLFYWGYLLLGVSVTALTRKRPEISSNASETRHLVPFDVFLLEQPQYAGALGRAKALLLTAGRALASYYDLVAASGRPFFWQNVGH
jgi:hypothetical protein